MDYTPVRPDGEIERIVDEYASELFRLCLVMLKKYARRRGRRAGHTAELFAARAGI